MIFPVIKTIDIETSIDWYEHFLGFICTYRNRITDPEYAVIEKVGMKIYIKSNNSNSIEKESVIVEVDNLEKTYSECAAAGVIFSSAIEPSEFGGQQFVVKDYDHNKIIFRSGG